MEKIVQTAGRDALAGFADDFAHFNDDILFGENWNNLDIDIKTRCIVTLVALMSSGITDSSLTYHLQNAKAHGLSQKEVAAIITHVGFYVGWPKAWAVFHLAKEIWAPGEGDAPYEDAAMRAHARSMLFPIGQANDTYAAYFTGKSYLAPVSQRQVAVHNVTFEPACRNNWHIHQASAGGGQVLICLAGAGLYQEWQQTPIALKPGDVVHIKAGVKHWHGAKKEDWFSHLAIEVPGMDPATEWLEPVSDEVYEKANQAASS
ncbi:carboxymuconolactone decarboxylase family protein [Peptococcus simiae]|uniref:Carboxymuconolactone decarboxylase family protein n=1 Tax=Peptococcus simiae TaxID=1643805 RepID=A0ABW9GY76_9FIRM